MMSHAVHASMRSRMLASEVLKRQRPARICTHDGAFHCDEALACFLLSRTRTFRENYTIVRTRDVSVIEDEATDVVVDVGGVFDAGRLRFDHHQRSFDEVFGHGFNTKLSSAGLVYREFGKEVIADECNIGEESEECHTLWLAVYKSFMESVDAIDNGINQYNFKELMSTEHEPSPKPRFVNNSGLSARVGGLNTDWNDPDADDAEKMRAKQLEQFHKAVAMTGAEFIDSVRYHKRAWLPARSVVMGAMKSRFEFHGSGRVLKLESRCPWKEHLNEIEDEMGLTDGEGKSILYVVYGDDKGQWRIQCVPQSPESFVSRKPLPASWRGVRDEDLSSVAGIEGCVFCHASGFIGGNRTLDGALQMVDKALKEDQ